MIVIQIRTNLYIIILRFVGSLHSKAETMPNLPHPIVYTSPERNKCLETCGWPRSSSVHRNPAEFDTIVKYLLVDGKF